MSRKPSRKSARKAVRKTRGKPKGPRTKRFPRPRAAAPTPRRGQRIGLSVNGRRQEGIVEPRVLLVDFLRNDLKLKGTHIGCDTSHCGACTVLVDGRAVKSCTMFAVQADGSKVLTVEGLLRIGRMHPLQQAFKDHQGLQCGFCTPGVLLSAYALLRDHPSPSEDEIRVAISGNLCRCTGYQTIVESIEAAAGTPA